MQVVEVPGVKRIPFVSSLLMDRWCPAPPLRLARDPTRMRKAGVWPISSGCLASFKRVFDQFGTRRRYPVNSVWKLLPWNGGPFEGRAPECSVDPLNQRTSCFRRQRDRCFEEA